LGARGSCPPAGEKGRGGQPPAHAKQGKGQRRACGARAPCARARVCMQVRVVMRVAGVVCRIAQCFGGRGEIRGVLLSECACVRVCADKKSLLLLPVKSACVSRVFVEKSGKGQRWWGEERAAARAGSGRVCGLCKTRGGCARSKHAPTPHLGARATPCPCAWGIQSRDDEGGWQGRGQCG
jgi:hypothetical protein